MSGVINASAQNTAADFVRLGEAERVLGQFQQANADFRQANQLAPQVAELFRRFVPTRVQIISPCPSALGVIRLLNSSRL